MKRFLALQWLALALFCTLGVLSLVACSPIDPIPPLAPSAITITITNPENRVVNSIWYQWSHAPESVTDNFDRATYPTFPLTLTIPASEYTTASNFSIFFNVNDDSDGEFASEEGIGYTASFDSNYTRNVEFALSDIVYTAINPPVSNSLGTETGVQYQSAIPVANDWKWVVCNLPRASYTVSWQDADGGSLGESGFLTYGTLADIRVEVYNAAGDLVTSSTGDVTSLTITGTTGANIRIKVIAENPGQFKFSLPN